MNFFDPLVLFNSPNRAKRMVFELYTTVDAYDAVAFVGILKNGTIMTGWAPTDISGGVTPVKMIGALELAKQSVLSTLREPDQDDEMEIGFLPDEEGV